MNKIKAVIKHEQTKVDDKITKDVFNVILLEDKFIMDRVIPDIKVKYVPALVEALQAKLKEINHE